MARTWHQTQYGGLARSFGRAGRLAYPSLHRFGNGSQSTSLVIGPIPKLLAPDPILEGHTEGADATANDMGYTWNPRSHTDG
jgi:hypothetical protein